MLHSIAFLLFFCPAVYALPMSLFRAWQVATCVVGVIATIEYVRMNRIDMGWVAFSLFFVVYYFISSLGADSNGWIVSIAYNSIKGVGFASLVYGSLRRDVKGCVLGFVVGGTVMCGLNYITFLVFKDSPSGMVAGGGLQNWYLLQHDNGTVFYYLPVAACLLYYGLAYGSKRAEIAGYVFTVLTTIMYLYLHSAAAMTVAVAFAAFIVYARGKDRRYGRWKFISSSCSVALGLALCAVVVLVGHSGLVADIANQFGKSYTFGLRLRIWDNAVGLFEENPVFGVGFNDQETRVRMLSFDHPHNLVLQIVFQGGAVSALLFVFMLYASGQRSFSLTAVSSLSGHVLGVCTLLMFVAGCVDFYPDQLPQYFPMMLAGYLAQGGFAFKGSSASREYVNDHSRVFSIS